MKKLQRLTLAVASATAVAAAGLGVAAATASAQPAATTPVSQPTANSYGGGGVAANEKVVESFLQDVINQHQMFSAHGPIFAQTKGVAQVLHAVDSIESCLRTGIDTTHQDIANRDLDVAGQDLG